MPRIPIYNITAQISGQAGSTSVPQISQASTSGAIASQTDSLSKGLNAISAVAANVVKIESDRIVAKENIKYKTMLDDTNKLIQANLANEPERWMEAYENGFLVGDQYVPGRAAIMGEISSKEYKYDFINNSVSNQLEVNNLAIREGLFENYLKETKKQNLLVAEDQAMILSGDLGESIGSDTIDFDVKLGLLNETLAVYQNGGGKDPLGHTQKVFKLALENALVAEYDKLPPENNINLLSSEVTNPNILTIMNYMDADQIRNVFENYSDEADERIKDFNSIKIKKIEEGKFAVSELFILYDNPETSVTEKNEIAKTIQGLDNIFFDKGEKYSFEQYHKQNVDNDYLLQYNKTGDEALTATLINQYTQGLISFADVRKNFSLLNIEQQTKLNSVKDQRATDQYNLASKTVRTYFGFSELSPPNPLSDNKTAEIFLEKSTSMAINLFNTKILETGKDQNYPALIDTIAKQVHTQMKENLNYVLNSSINNSLELNFEEQYLPMAKIEITPKNIKSVIEQYVQNVQNDKALSDGEKNSLIFRSSNYDFEYGDLQTMFESYAE